MIPKSITEIPLIEHNSIKYYRPSLGDFIIKHGYISNEYGVISGINETNQSIRVITSGMPLLLFNLDQEEQEKNSKTIKISKIINSKATYTICQQNIWYC